MGIAAGSGAAVLPASAAVLAHRAEGDASLCGISSWKACKHIVKEWELKWEVQH